jgi:hypothetical protein
VIGAENGAEDRVRDGVESGARDGAEDGKDDGGEPGARDGSDVLYVHGGEIDAGVGYGCWDYQEKGLRVYYRIALALTHSRRLESGRFGL